VPGLNLSRAEAKDRADHLYVNSYVVTLDVTKGEETFYSKSEVSFTCNKPGYSTFIDAVGSSVISSTLNGAPVDTINFVTNLTKAQMKQIIPWLDKFGASKADISTVGNAKKYLQNNFNTYVENANGSLSKLIQLFKDDYVPSADETEKTKSNGVTQYVTKQAPELIAKDVDKFLLASIGSKNINEEGRRKIMDEVQKMIDAGATTTSKMDKTGKTTVTQTPGYSEERLGEVVERVAKEAEPGKYQQQKQATFYDFIINADQLRGGR
jgi:hypothetical protein